MTEIEQLGQYVSGAIDAALPEPALRKAKQHTLDTIGAIVTGSSLRPGKAGAAYVAAQSSSGLCTVAGSLLKSTPSLAALANGMSAHADETDDSHEPSLSHPGCGIVPAALATAEVTDRTVDELLRAVAVGYDVGVRVVLAIGIEHILPWEANFSTHSFVNTFGAAASAASLWRLAPHQTAWALSYAAQQASGITSWVRDKNHVEKAFVFAGMPARNGVAAAEMVHLGWDGVDDVFNGYPNFLDILSPAPERAQVVHELGDRFEVCRSNIKKYAVGSPAQAVLQALEDLIEEEAVDMDAVKTVRIALPADIAGVMDRRSMADVNMQYLAAATLKDGRASFAMAHDYERMRGGEMQDFMRRVDLVADPEMKPKTRQARVDITLKDGRYRSRHVPAVRGSWQDPMTDEELIAKFRNLVEPVLGDRNCLEVIETVMHERGSVSARHLGRILQVEPSGR